MTDGMYGAARRGAMIPRRAQPKVGVTGRCRAVLRRDSAPVRPYRLKPYPVRSAIGCAFARAEAQAKDEADGPAASARVRARICFIFRSHEMMTDGDTIDRLNENGSDVSLSFTFL